jgi:hypothetical protein
MQSISISAPPSWDDFAALQNSAANRRQLDHKAWALEEQLDSFAELLSDSPSNEASAGKAKPVLNLVANRSKKFRRRDQLLRDSYQHICRKSCECRTIELLSRRESITEIRLRLSEDELRIFEDLADGADYLSIAGRHRMTQSALKSRISRCRQRVRNSHSFI